MNIFELIFLYLFVFKAQGLSLYCRQNESDREKPKHSEEYMSKCHVVHHESRKKLSEIEHEDCYIRG
jgi:hypothetical protein